MDVKMKVKMLVQQAVEAYLKEQNQVEQTKSIAVLLNYQSVQPKLVLEAVSLLFNSYDITLIVSKDWTPFFKDRSYYLLEDLSQQELKGIVERTSLLVVPAASYQFVSKLALTMDDEIAVWLSIQYQLDGKPIIAANNHIELNAYQQILAPHSVQERLQSYIRQIQADQVKWVPLSKLNNAVTDEWNRYKEKKPLILEKHIQTAHRDGLSEIVLPGKSQVTPAAKDLAKELKIQINKLAPRREDS